MAYRSCNGHCISQPFQSPPLNGEVVVVVLELDVELEVDELKDVPVAVEIVVFISKALGFL